RAAKRVSGLARQRGAALLDSALDAVGVARDIRDPQARAARAIAGGYLVENRVGEFEGLAVAIEAFLRGGGGRAGEEAGLEVRDAAGLFLETRAAFLEELVH